MSYIVILFTALASLNTLAASKNTVRKPSSTPQEIVKKYGLAHPVPSSADRFCIYRSRAPHLGSNLFAIFFSSKNSTCRIIEEKYSRESSPSSDKIVKEPWPNCYGEFYMALTKELNGSSEVSNNPENYKQVSGSVGDNSSDGDTTWECGELH